MRPRILSYVVVGLLAFAALPAFADEPRDPQPMPPSGICARQLYADVVALDQPYFWNRLGAVQPHGMVYALKRDVVGITGFNPGPGNARLRSEKRPRPLVLRMNVGDCLTVKFTNWLGNTPADNEQVRTREASIHVVGMQLVSDIRDDGSWVGTNSSGLAVPGQTVLYKLYAEKEGTHVLHSGGAMTSGEGDNGTISAGLFGAVNVEPASSVWYRSQVTQTDLARTITSFKLLNRTDNGVTWTERHPVIDYNKTHPLTHPSRPGLPILKMLAAPGSGAPPGTQWEVIYSDLTAIVVQQGISIEPIDPKVYPRRSEPFREFTIIFHDEPGAVQAFSPFYDRDGKPGNDATGLAYTLHSVRDAFGINYGTGGIGAEILANRLGVGPMHDCENCLYEEFFLSSWAVGDPAMVVDIPANAPCDDDPFDNYQGPGAYESNTVSEYAEMEENHESPKTPCLPTPGPKATVALYPEDPSNVYHSYLDDHVKFRNLLAGSDDHHIFHLHAHQWLHTPNEDNSAYKDSQAIGQGTGFTYEIAHEGSGNRNKTPGDSIFHCHFYPHFAMGMWGMWRVHDVLELGTPIDNATGRPKPGSRALPDGEIAAGTPIPGLVPLPGEPMPPPPSVQVSIAGGQVQISSIGGQVYGNPGYPFWIPGIAGKRVPEPPMDVFEEGGVHHDGGLPRHIVVDADIALELHTRLDFSKEITNIDAVVLADDGEPWEKSAMRWHADQLDAINDGFMNTFKPNGQAANGTSGHEVNGSIPVKGAPYADPCYRPPPTGYPNAQFDREYRAANIQMDVAFNTAGWHFPQQRFISLWGDVNAFLNGSKEPEPLFIRANTYDCVTYLHTNLVPRYYEMDDFQVRTPTDILGQHIHLVKFDVTSSDGSANGFNYEDGTLSYEEVVHLIQGINLAGGIILDPDDPEKRELLTVKNHPYFGIPGARTTVQRWYVDDVLNNGLDNRSLRTVFTHDHFGPSTHQQVGLYAGLLTYKGTSATVSWHDAVTGVEMGNRFDGGPTSWQAVIRGPDEFREFALEFGDFQHAYWGSAGGFPSPRYAINPPGRKKQWDDLAGSPWIYEKPFLVGQCPNGHPPPCPEAITADDPGTSVVNYKNEPLALRVTDNSGTLSPNLAPAPRGDLSYAFSSTVHGDPFTPILEAYEEDEVRMRILVGAHENEHNFSVHGTRWLTEPDAVNSGYKSSQMMGISEWFEFEIPHLLGATNPGRGYVDFLYKAGSSNDDLWDGIWGLIRVYNQPRIGQLEPIDRSNPVPSNEVDVNRQPEAPRPSPPELDSSQTPGEGTISTSGEAGFGLEPVHASVCPANSLPPRVYNVVAVAVSQALPGGQLVYNPRTTSLDDCVRIDQPYGYLDGVSCSPSGLTGPLVDPTGIMFVRAEDLNPDGTLKLTAPVEPLILRARAGECIQVNFKNRLPAGTYAADLNGFSLLPNILDRFNQNQVPPSARVGLHPTLLAYDGLLSDGVNVGFNPEQSVPPGHSRTYVWYAGDVTVANDGSVIGTPIEFGAVPIYSTDPIKHTNKGAVGAIIIEPAGAKWREYPRSRAKALVDPTPALDNGDTFREFVLVVQDDINLYLSHTAHDVPVAVRPLAVSEDPAETGQAAFNYRTEPVWFRKEYLPQLPPEVTRNFQMADTFTNALVGGDPVTPLFRAVAGEPIRFRLVHPGGDGQQHVWGLHGHIWQEQPWTQASTKQGSNAASEWKGAEHGFGPTGAFNHLLENGAGGAFQVNGDYMYRDHVPWYLVDGLWGIFRVFDTRPQLDTQEPEWLGGLTPVSEGAQSGTAANTGFDATVPQR